MPMSKRIFPRRAEMVSLNRLSATKATFFKAHRGVPWLGPCPRSELTRTLGELEGPPARSSVRHSAILFAWRKLPFRCRARVWQLHWGAESLSSGARKHTVTSTTLLTWAGCGVGSALLRPGSEPAGPIDLPYKASYAITLLLQSAGLGYPRARAHESCYSCWRVGNAPAAIHAGRP
jgi:hypothetical protein